MNKVINNLEETFLDKLSSDTFDVSELLDMLKLAYSEGEKGIASSCAELLFDKLVEIKDEINAINLYRLIADNTQDTKEFRKDIIQSLREIIKNRRGITNLESSGFDNDKVSLRECFRRLDTIRCLEKGILCYEKTWGFGVIKDVDEFYKKVIVDFTKKSNHQMSFSYAAESLRILDDSHILVINYKAPDKLKELINQKPSEIIKMLIRDFGPQSIITIQEMLRDFNIILDENWKSFWDKARKELKADPKVNLPSKRSEPIELLDREKNYDSQWFELLSAKNDIGEIISMISELAKSDLKDVSAENLNKLINRINYIILSCEDTDSVTMARLYLILRNIDWFKEDDILNRIAKSLISADAFISAVKKISAKDVSRITDVLIDIGREEFINMILSNLQNIPVSVFPEIVKILEAKGLGERCFNILRENITERTANPVLLLWVGKNLEKAKNEKLGNLSDISAQMIDILNITKSGELLKAQNHIKSLFSSEEWLSELLRGLDKNEKKYLLQKINNCAGWESVDKRSILAKIVKIDNDLKEIVTKTDDDIDKSAVKGRYTSWRSYRERAEQYKKLIEVDIPSNSKDIAHARSYGDLRENHEYKSAKEHQVILLKKKEDLEADLKNVQGVDFKDFPCDKAGMGTIVWVHRPSSGEQRYVLLGEWDRDEKLGIISSRSKLSTLLDGHVVGDEVSLPTDTGEEICKILRIEKLNNEILEWAK